MTTPSLIVLATALALLAEARYLHSVLTGRSRPSTTAWLIFTLATGCALASALALGARESLFLLAIYAVLHLTTALLASRHGFVRPTRFDIVCISLTALGIGLWIATASPWFALIQNTLVDACGYAVVARKLYLHPGTEDRAAWLLGCGSYAINLGAVGATGDWCAAECLFSLSNAIWCAAIFSLAWRAPAALGRSTTDELGSPGFAGQPPPSMATERLTLSDDPDLFSEDGQSARASPDPPRHPRSRGFLARRARPRLSPSRARRVALYHLERPQETDGAPSRSADGNVFRRFSRRAGGRFEKSQREPGPVPSCSSRAAPVVGSESAGASFAGSAVRPGADRDPCGRSQLGLRSGSGR